MRVSAFIVVCATGFLTPFPLFVFCTFLYLFFWPGYEILFIAVCVDSFFGTQMNSFLYTLTSGGLICISEVLRPYLSWYTTNI